MSVFVTAFAYANAASWKVKLSRFTIFWEFCFMEGGGREREREREREGERVH